MKFFVRTPAEKDPFDALLKRVRPTNGWDNPCSNEPVLSDFHCSATLSECDFEGVTCAVTGCEQRQNLVLLLFGILQAEKNAQALPR